MADVKFGKRNGLPMVRFTMYSNTSRLLSVVALKLARGVRIESIANAETGKPVARVTFDRHEAQAGNMASVLFNPVSDLYR